MQFLICLIRWVQEPGRDGILLTTFAFILREAYYKVVWKYANVAKFLGIILLQAY